MSRTEQLSFPKTTPTITFTIYTSAGKRFHLRLPDSRRPDNLVVLVDKDANAVESHVPGDGGVLGNGGDSPQVGALEADGVDSGLSVHSDGVGPDGNLFSRGEFGVLVRISPQAKANGEERSGNLR